MTNVSKMQRFPILRLPILAINEVLITMNPFELINFSMCNPTTKCIVKLFFRKKRGFEILLGNSSTLSVAILGSQKRIWKYHIINDQSAEIPESIYEVAIRYSEDVLGEWKSLFEYIDDLMNFKTIDEFFFDLDGFPDLNQPMIKCLKTWSKPVKWLEMWSENQADDILKQLLSEVTITGTLHIFTPLSDNFQLTIPKLLNVAGFHDAKWIKFNQLLELDAKEISLRENRFTDVELIAFFQSWMLSGSHVNLKRFRIRIEKESVFEAIFQELPHEIVSFWFWRKYLSGPKIIDVPFGIAITRNDGKVGRMFLETLGNRLFLVFMVF